MARLAGELRTLAPPRPWDQPMGSMGGFGDEPMPLPAAVGAVEALSDLDELEQSLSGDYAGATLEDIDEEKLRRTLGDEAATDLRRRRQDEKVLEEAGVPPRQRGKPGGAPRRPRPPGERAPGAVSEPPRRR